tara:strand:+ start:445 stop:774 length:330 start_codon:yes stop_codon:yes gene_type:complete
MKRCVVKNQISMKMIWKICFGISTFQSQGVENCVKEEKEEEDSSNRRSVPCLCIHHVGSVTSQEQSSMLREETIIAWHHSLIVKYDFASCVFQEMGAKRSRSVQKVDMM